MGSLVINRPFEEPTRFWEWDERRKDLVVKNGRRDPEYRLGTHKVETDEKGQGMFTFKEAAEIRDKLAGWRASEYSEASAVSRMLLQHWTAEGRSSRLFFCQREAIETLIWLAETSDGRKLAEEIEGDGGDIMRLCCKMATGTGKTVVMAMLVAWQTLNWYENRESVYVRSFLAVAPSLIVRDRLAVLKPEDESNYYDSFDLVPPGHWREVLQAHAKVLILNWHKLGWQTEEEIAKKKSVDKRGALSDRAWLELLLDRTLPVNEKICVINDEAHHAWRIPEGVSEKDYKKADIKDATKWIEGLERLDRAVGITYCYDFSATPFIPASTKKNSTAEERMFGWVVSDFGLSEAIESGLVKTPRIPRRDEEIDLDINSRPDNYLYHIYNEEGVSENLKPEASLDSRIHSKVEEAYNLLGSNWKAVYDSWQQAGTQSPPVMISIANNTLTAQRIYEHFTGEPGFPISELKNKDTTLHIDSASLAKAEKEEGASDELRKKVKNVGVLGTSGEQIRHVISVEMLSEGWDAKNVTHIMGLRAFTSQLLCEQVIGRGLRRSDYENFDSNGYYEAEYVRVFGVPFQFLLMQEDEAEDKQKPPAPPAELVTADPSKQYHAIDFPDIERVNREDLEFREVGVPDIPIFILDGDQILDEAELANSTPWLQAQNGETVTLQSITGLRLQTLAFRAALQIGKEHSSEFGNPTLVHQLAGLTADFAKSAKLKVTSDRGSRESVVKLGMLKVAEHVADSLLVTETRQHVKYSAVYRDIHKPVTSTLQMRDWHTKAKKEKLYRNHIKCHLNVVVCDTRLERNIAEVLEAHSNVKSWIKNDRDHIGFKIGYVFEGVARNYVPDFVVEAVDGRKLIVEAKGVAEAESQAKQDYTDRWVAAVNSTGRHGVWSNAGMFFGGDIGKLKVLLESG